MSLPAIYTGLLKDNEKWLDLVNRTTKVLRQIGFAKRIQYLDSNGAYTGPTSQAIAFIADTGGVAAGDICAVTGYDSTTGYMKLDKADADSAALAKNLWWSPSAVAAAATGYARKSGMYTSALNTSGSTLGDPVYLSETDGGLSLTEPATGTDVIVKVGTVASLDGSAGVIAIDLGGGESIAIHDHADNAGGGTITIGAALTGTSQETFTVDAGTTHSEFKLSAPNAGSTGFDLELKAAQIATADRTVTLPDPGGADNVVYDALAATLTNKTLTTPTIGDFTNSTHDHTNAAGGGTITITASTGTTNATFDILSGGNYVRLDSDTLTQPSTYTFPDVASDELCGIAATQTLTNKTLTNATLDGIIGGGTPRDGSFSTLSSSSAATLASLVCTAGATFSGGYGSTGTTITEGGAISTDGSILIAADDTTDGVVERFRLIHSSSDNNATAGDGVAIAFHLENATGTSTVEEWASIDAVSTTITNGSEDGDLVFSQMLAGTVTESVRFDSSAQELVVGRNATDANGMSGIRIYPVTSARGSLVLTAAAHASADRATTITNATDGGAAATVTLPNATSTLATIGLAESFSGIKTFTAAPVIAIDDANNATVTDVITLTHTTSGAPGAGIGTGISVIIENDTDATTQAASIDFVETGDGTKATMDTDIIFSSMIDGAVTEGMRIDASDNSLTIGADTSLVSKIRIHPTTTASGTLVIQAADNTGDTDLTVTNVAQGGANTAQIPDIGAGATDQFVMEDVAQTLTNKTLTAPVLTTPQINTGMLENGAAGAVSSVHRLVIRKDAIADGVATAVITVTCPNAAHAAALKVTALAMVDDQESARCAEGMAIFSRNAGANLVGALATLELAQIATGGAETLTLAYSLSAAVGAVGASNTMDLQFTLNTSAAANGEIVVLAELINGEATGVTMAAS